MYLTWKHLLIGGGIVALAFAVISSIIALKGVAPESILHLFGYTTRRESGNRQDVRALRHYLNRLQHSESTFALATLRPPRRFGDIIVPSVYAEFRKDNPVADAVINGIDRFGTPYLFFARLTSKSKKRASYNSPGKVSAIYEILIRSFGPNGVDDHGKNDDVEITEYLEYEVDE